MAASAGNPPADRRILTAGANHERNHCRMAVFPACTLDQLDRFPGVVLLLLERPCAPSQQLPSTVSHDRSGLVRERPGRNILRLSGVDDARAGDACAAKL